MDAGPGQHRVLDHPNGRDQGARRQLRVAVELEIGVMGGTERQDAELGLSEAVMDRR